MEKFKTLTTRTQLWNALTKVFAIDLPVNVNAFQIMMESHARELCAQIDAVMPEFATLKASSPLRLDVFITRLGMPKNTLVAYAILDEEAQTAPYVRTILHATCNCC